MCLSFYAVQTLDAWVQPKNCVGAVLLKTQFSHVFLNNIRIRIRTHLLGDYSRSARKERLVQRQQKTISGYSYSIETHIESLYISNIKTYT